MLAAIGLVLFIIAAILELVKQHLDWVIWLVIIGGALVAADVIWGWRRAGAGYYRRGAP
jgi:hypothetical protein